MAHVRFKGMPNARFWDFENGTLDFGDLKPDKRDLARLALIDFMLVHANDWFMLPVDIPVGATYQLDTLVVHDVFGIDTLIERADKETLGPGWTMFSTSVSGQIDTVADFFLWPPSAGAGLQSGRVIEEVRFARDEMANMVWGIENIVENAAGEPWPQRRREEPGRAAGGRAARHRPASIEVPDQIAHSRILDTVPARFPRRGERNRRARTGGCGGKRRPQPDIA
jgi:hypothetical protein